MDAVVHQPQQWQNTVPISCIEWRKPNGKNPIRCSFIWGIEDIDLVMSKHWTSESSIISSWPTPLHSLRRSVTHHGVQQQASLSGWHRHCDAGSKQLQRARLLSVAVWCSFSCQHQWLASRGVGGATGLVISQFGFGQCQRKNVGRKRDAVSHGPGWEHRQWWTWSPRTWRRRRRCGLAPGDNSVQIHWCWSWRSQRLMFSWGLHHN